jgi:hypothetical protein
MNGDDEFENAVLTRIDAHPLRHTPPTHRATNGATQAESRKGG